MPWSTLQPGLCIGIGQSAGAWSRDTQRRGPAPREDLEALCLTALDGLSDAVVGMPGHSREREPAAVAATAVLASRGKTALADAVPALSDDVTDDVAAWLAER
ncbi:MAG: hypothetical protein AAFV86_16865 [Pseudomonadota bacterium]